jgi:hypothetical protein
MIRTSSGESLSHSADRTPTRRQGVSPWSQSLTISASRASTSTAARANPRRAASLALAQAQAHRAYAAENGGPAARTLGPSRVSGCPQQNRTARPAPASGSATGSASAARPESSPSRDSAQPSAPPADSPSSSRISGRTVAPPLAAWAFRAALPRTGGQAAAPPKGEYQAAGTVTQGKCGTAARLGLWQEIRALAAVRLGLPPQAIGERPFGA